MIHTTFGAAPMAMAKLLMTCFPLNTSYTIPFLKECALLSRNWKIEIKLITENRNYQQESILKKRTKPK